MIEDNQLTFKTIVIKGNTGYASAYEKNGLYEVNIKTGECTFLGNFKEKALKRGLHSKAVRIKNKVFFVPDAADSIAVYDIEMQDISSISLPIITAGKNRFYSADMKFIDALQQGNFLWLIPSTFPGVLRLNLITYEYTLFDSWIPKEGYIFRAEACVEGNSFIIPSVNNNYVLKFNMNSQSAQSYRIGKENHGILCMKKIRGEYYLAPCIAGPIIAWNPSSGSIKEYMDYPDSFEGGNGAFCDIYSREGKVYFIPMEANMGIVMDGGVLKEDKTIFKKCEKTSDIFKVFETSTHVCYHEYRYGAFRRYFMVNINNREISEKYYCIVNISEDIKKTLEHASKGKEFMFDDGIFGINDLLLQIK